MFVYLFVLGRYKKVLLLKKLEEEEEVATIKIKEPIKKEKP